MRAGEGPAEVGVSVRTEYDEAMSRQPGRPSWAQHTLNCVALFKRVGMGGPHSHTTCSCSCHDYSEEREQDGKDSST